MTWDAISVVNHFRDCWEINRVAIRVISLYLIIACKVTLASYSFLLCYFHQTITKTINHEDHKRQWTQDVGSKPKQNPSKGKTQLNLPFLYNQINKKSKTQTSRPRPPTRSKLALLSSSSNKSKSTQVKAFQIWSSLKFFVPVAEFQTYSRSTTSHMWGI